MPSHHGTAFVGQPIISQKSAMERLLIAVLQDQLQRSAVVGSQEGTLRDLCASRASRACRPPDSASGYKAPQSI
jgi:hypothetical protein